MTLYEAQGGATSRADAILIFRGVNLSVVHCITEAPCKIGTNTVSITDAHCNMVISTYYGCTL